MLSRLYTKLGVHSRTELVRRLADRSASQESEFADFLTTRPVGSVDRVTAGHGGRGQEGGTMKRLIGRLMATGGLGVLFALVSASAADARIAVNHTETLLLAE